MYNSNESKSSNESLKSDFAEDFFNQHFLRVDCWTETLKSNLEKWFDLKNNPANILSPEFIQKTTKILWENIAEKYRENPIEWSSEQNNLANRMEELFTHIIDHVAGKSSPPIIIESPNDKRFKDEEWLNNPAFSYIKQAYLLQCEYFQNLVNKTSLDEETKKKPPLLLKI